MTSFSAKVANGKNESLNDEDASSPTNKQKKKMFKKCCCSEWVSTQAVDRPDSVWISCSLYFKHYFWHSDAAADCRVKL